MAASNKIVLSGYYGFDNIGDEAVLYSIVSILREEIPHVQITVLSNNPEKTRATYGVESVNRWDLKAVTKVIKASDLLISGGGSLLQDVTSGKTVPYYLGIVKIAQFFKKKVVFYSQGIGPVNKGFSRFLIKQIVNHVDGIFVREPASKALLQEIGVKREIGVSIDPVIGIKVKEKEMKSSSKKVGVYLRPWQDQAHDQNLIESLKPGLEALIQEGYEIYFIPMHYEQDLEIAKSLGQALLESTKAKEAIHVVDQMLSIEEVLHYTKSFELVIGMRLHSLIMAAALQVPMLALSYDPKVTAFMKEIEVSHCLQTPELTKEAFTKELEAVETTKAAQKQHLIKMYEQKKEKIYLPVNYIKQALK